MKMKNLLMTTIAIFGLALISNAQVPNYVPSNGLVGWWPFNGNANDESLNGNDGTNNGATLTVDRFQNANSAYSFNGSSNYISVASASSLNFGTNIDLTITAWINLSGSNVNYAGIVEKMNVLPNNSGIGYQFLLVSDKLNCEFGQDASILSGLNGTTNLNDNQWHQITWVVDRESNSHTFYLDNIIQSIVNNTNISLANVDNTSNLKIGVERGHNYYFYGKIH